MRWACVDQDGNVAWSSELPPTLDGRKLFQAGAGQRIVEAPDDVRGKRLQGDEWVDLPEPEIDPLIELRAERDRLLAASDWTQLPDAPLTDSQRAAWRDYRQALRDLPETGDDWPASPDYKTE